MVAPDPALHPTDDINYLAGELDVISVQLRVVYPVFDLCNSCFSPPLH
jgi:hypothetical protein